LLAALGPVLRRLLGAGGLHPLIDGGLVGAGIVGALDAQVDDLDAELRSRGALGDSSRVRVISSARREEMISSMVAAPQLLTQSRGDHRPQAVLGLGLVAQAAIELQRIIDAVADEGVDHEAVLVAADDLGLLRLQLQDQLVEAARPARRTGPLSSVRRVAGGRGR
jgi:hypothetical protein